jgi:hypothetical protein
MMTSISNVTFPARRWHGPIILGASALTALAIQIDGISYRYQILVAAIFIPLMILSYVRSTMERLGDIKPQWLETSTGSVDERRQILSGPSENPFEFDNSALTLDERITVVTDVCRQFGRHVSVIHFQLHVADRATFERAAAVLRAAVRRTDYVESVSEKEIVVCLNMIRGLGEAELVMRRLSTSLEKSQIDRAQWNAGCAMYPVHGYNGADLIAFARQICTGAIDERNRELRRRSTEPAARDTLSASAEFAEATGVRDPHASGAKTATKRRAATKSRVKKNLMRR